MLLCALIEISLAGKILDNTNADVAVDQYHRYQVMMGLPFFFDVNDGLT